MIRLNFIGETKEVLQGIQIMQRRLHYTIAEDGYTVLVQKGCDGLTVGTENGVFLIRYQHKAAFFRGLAILADKLRQRKTTFLIRETPRFRQCGTMLDVSRNAVLTVETVKDFTERIALMGLTMLMLYTEDVYEIQQYPWFGYMRGAYTQAELREMDNHCRIFGIELIPCIQTLSHLGCALRWPYAKDIKDMPGILLVDEAKTYELIEEMFRTCRACFSSRQIHIGLDEAVGMGLGNYLKHNSYTPVYDLMIRHIQKVAAIAERYGFTPMMWSDMFFRLGAVQSDYAPEAVVPADAAEKLPQHISMVYWDYDTVCENRLQCLMEKHKELKRELIFAGGIWTWNRLTPNMEKSFKTAQAQLSVCKKQGIKTVFATVWENGSMGGCNIYTVLPGLQMYAEQNYHDEVDKEHLANMFRICTGYDLNTFLVLYIDDFTDEEKEKYADPSSYCVNPAFQQLFCDVLLGLLDQNISQYDFAARYRRYIQRLERTDVPEDLQWLFEYHKKMAEVLKDKCDIGVRLTQSYREKNASKLKEIAAELGGLLKRYAEFHVMLGDAWHRTNKAFGWDALDMHLGAAEARMKWAIHRLEQYISGQLNRLEELEAERLPYDGLPQPLFETAVPGSIMTVSAIHPK